MTDPKPAAETPPRCPPCECGAAYGHTLGCVRRDRAMLDFTCSICKRVHPDPAPAASLSPSPAPRCTGLTATWCPIHGVCRCEKNGAGEPSLDDERCALHSTVSEHADDEPAPAAAPALPQGSLAPEQIALVRSIAEAVGPGPWTVTSMTVHQRGFQCYVRVPAGVVNADTADRYAALIESARPALLDLLDALSRERTAREQAERERDEESAAVRHWKRASDNRDATIRLIEEARDRYAADAQAERSRAEALRAALSGLLEVWPEPVDAFLTRKETAALDAARAALSAEQSKEGR